MNDQPIGKKTVRDIDVRGKRVLIRADLNVPLDDGAVSDDTRIRESLPTILFVLEQGGTVVLCSHLGRPKGRDASLSLGPVAARLGNLLDREIFFADDCVGPSAEAVVAALAEGGIALLENLRFHPEEETNDPAFAKQLASLADYLDLDGHLDLAADPFDGLTVRKGLVELPSASGLGLRPVASL